MKATTRRGEDSRRLLRAGALLAVVALLASGAWALLRSDPGARQSRKQPETAASAETTSASASTIEDEAEFVAAQLRAGQAEWGDEVTGVQVSTLLRRPVIEVATALEGEDADGAEALAGQLGDFALGLETPSASRPTYCIHILSAEGDLLATRKRTDERWQLQTPPTPSDAGGLKSWLDTVYRSDAADSESWTCHVLDVMEPSLDPDGYLAIRTDLDPEHEGDLAEAQIILWAANSSGATFAPGIRITFADPEFEWTGVMDGRDIFASE